MWNLKNQFSKIAKNVTSQDSDMIRVMTKNRFEIVNGDPRFNRDYTELPALQMVEEWIRHNYREGWEQI